MPSLRRRRRLPAHTTIHTQERWTASDPFSGMPSTQMWFSFCSWASGPRAPLPTLVRRSRVLIGRGRNDAFSYTQFVQQCHTHTTEALTTLSGKIIKLFEGGHLFSSFLFSPTPKSDLDIIGDAQALYTGSYVADPDTGRPFALRMTRRTKYARLVLKPWGLCDCVWSATEPC